VAVRAEGKAAAARGEATAAAVTAAAIRVVTAEEIPSDRIS
jgi:hypothetical protein